jgi:short-subunit dehydrogenase
MVSLPEVQSSNSRIATTLPPGLVAVFVGATNGIGETTLKQFAKHTRQPRVYFVGRSQEAGDRIAAECNALNSNGRYVFIKADTSLIQEQREGGQSAVSQHGNADSWCWYVRDSLRLVVS